MDIHFKVLLAVLMFGLLSCQDTIFDKELAIDSERKLAVYCLLSPDSDIVASVRLTHGTYEEGKANDFLNKQLNDLVTGATVELTDLTTQQRVTMSEQKPSVYYVKKNGLHIISGHSYQLDISYLNSTVTAHCTIPLLDERPKISSSSAYYVPEKIIREPFLFSKEEPRYEVSIGVHPTKSATKNVFLRRTHTNLTNSVKNYYSYFLSAEQLPNYDELVFKDSHPDELALLNYGLFVFEPQFYQYLVYEKEINDLRRDLEQNPVFAFNGIVKTITNIKGGVGIFVGCVKTDSLTINLSAIPK